jgi:hypothetical protein
MSMNKKTSFRWYSVIHLLGREELQEICVFPKQEYGEHCTLKARTHTTCSKCYILDTEILARGWTLVSVSMTITGCIFYILFTDEAQSSREGTILMCGQMGILTSLWKATSKNIALPLCGVVCRSGLSADWYFLPSKDFYRTGLPTISAGGNAPTFGGCACE